MRTYSFSELDNAKGVGKPSEDAAGASKKESGKTLTDCTKPPVCLSPATSGQPSLKAVSLQPRDAANNPFFEPDSQSQDLSAHLATKSADASMVRAADKPPEYAANRKSYVGSPNLQLRKRPNPRARFLPKAFSVDIAAMSPISTQKKLINVDDIAAQARSPKADVIASWTMVNSGTECRSKPLAAAIELTEKSIGKAGSARARTEEPHKEEDKGKNELLLAGESARGKTKCCVKDAEAGKCDCVIV